MRKQHLGRIIIASSLLVAAALKLYGLGVSTVPKIGWFSQPWVQLAVVEWEVVLGLWLVSNVRPVGSWLAAVGTFTTFALVSGYLGLAGVSSCGCLGVIRVNPWYAFGADLAAVSLLLVSRPLRPVPEAGLTWAPYGDGVRWLAGVSVLLAGMTAGATWVLGSPDAAIALLRGETVSVDPGYVDLGGGWPGDRLDAVAAVKNWTERPVRLYGGTSDCSCTTLDDLPITIPPRSSADVGVRLRIPRGSHGELTRTVFLLTDCAEQPMVTFRVGFRVE